MDRTIRTLAAALTLVVCTTHGAWASPFNINIVAGSGLSSNSAALAAFDRAAAQWEARIVDPVTININANLAALGSGVIGSTSSVELQSSYTSVRTKMIADTVAYPNDAIVASLPLSISATLPAGFTASTNVTYTKANGKALGYLNLDSTFGSSDGSITFSTAFNFDYDRSDGITPGAIDFETVAAHEIGHLLGFVSTVDTIDQTLSTGGVVNLHTLDLFRFANNVSGQDPSNASQFTSYPRNLVPGTDAIFDDTSIEYRMSTGVTNGDGRQASHWKDDALASIHIGIMDPTLASGVSFNVNDADFRALDLIGYDVVSVPEPGTWTLLALGGAGMLLVRRRVGKNGAKKLKVE